MLKDWSNSTFKVFSVIYSSFHMWFNLPHHVVQPAPYGATRTTASGYLDCSFFAKTIYIENLRQTVIDKT